MVADTVPDYRGFTDALLLPYTPGQALRGDILRAPLMAFYILVNAPPAYWVCRILGYWCAVLLRRYCGRRGAVCAAVGLRLAGILYAMISSTFSLNEVSSAFSAMAKGMFLCITPMYLAETSPIPARGSILLTWQLFVFPCMKRRKKKKSNPANSLDNHLGLEASEPFTGFGSSQSAPKLLYTYWQHSCFSALGRASGCLQNRRTGTSTGERCVRPTRSCSSVDRLPRKPAAIYTGCTHSEQVTDGHAEQNDISCRL